MQELEQRTHSIWKRLKLQFRWTLVESEAAFVETVVRLLEMRPSSSNLTDTEISVSIQQLYNRSLYEALVNGLQNLDNEKSVDMMHRAGEEIRLNALRQLRSKGYDQNFAEDLAQQVLIRLIEKPNAIRDPGCLPAWIRWQILDLIKIINRRRPDLSLDVDDSSEHPVGGSYYPMQQIDDTLFVEVVLNELPTILSPFQLRVIQLVVFEERSAIDAATILGVKPHQVRAEKARALAKIRRHITDQS